MLNHVRFGLVAAFLAVGMAPSSAAILNCEIHDRMRIWFLDYAESDTHLEHPLGVGSGLVDINEGKWHAKCVANGPNSKVYVPFNATSGIESGQWDTRFPRDIYRTRAEAERAYRSY